jgi:hypothetical protein
VLEKTIEKQQTIRNRAIPLMVSALTLIGAGLRFYAIGTKGLWLDEAFSVWLGWQPLPEMLAWLLKVDQHPPLYYILLHLWMVFGDTASVVRSLSALMGTLTIPLFYTLGKKIGGWQLGLVTALLLTFSPFHIRFAQETRMYTTLTFNACAAIISLVHLLTDPRTKTDAIGEQLIAYFNNWRSSRKSGSGIDLKDTEGYQRDYRQTSDWVDTPTRRRWLPIKMITTDLAWLGYIIFSTATMLSHNTAVLYPVAVNLFVFSLIGLSKRKPSLDDTSLKITPPSLRNWLWAQFWVFLLWSPWLAAFIIQATGVYGEFWIPAPTIDTVFNTFTTFLSWSLPPQGIWDEIIWVVFGLLIIAGFLHFRKRTATISLLLTLFLVPAASELLVSLERPIFYDRTLIWTTLPLLLLIAAGIIQLRFKAYILTACGFVIAVNALSLQNYYAHFQKEQWNLAAKYVAGNVELNDILIFNATWVQIPFDFYFRFYNRDVEERGAPVDLFDRGILEPKMAESDIPRLRSLIRDRNRAWLIYSHNWYTDPKNLITTALQQELNLLESRRFYGLEVRLYGIH